MTKSVSHILPRPSSDRREVMTWPNVNEYANEVKASLRATNRRVRELYRQETLSLYMKVWSVHSNEDTRGHLR